MKREIINENRLKILFTVIALLVVLVISFCINWFIYWTTKQNDEVVLLKLDEITYTEKKADKEFKELQLLEEKSPLSAKAKGQLFKAMSEISYMNKDDVIYNRYIAKALFYLRKSKNEADCVYITNKYIGRLYANGCYVTASDVLKRLEKKYEIDKLPLNLQASYYLSCADVAQVLNKDISKYIEKSDKTIDSMPNGGEKELNKAKYNLLRARKLINEKDFDKAEEIMSAYSETSDFGFSNDQVYVVCDFRIPYYEISTKLALNRKDYLSASYCIERYIRDCESYHFRAMKLRLLQYVVANDGSEEVKLTENHQIMAKQASDSYLAEMTGKYGKFLLDNIDNTTRDMETEEKEKENRKSIATKIVVSIYIIILLLCLCSILSDYVNRDGLTHLSNRKKYEHLSKICERKKIPHCLLVLDVDNFKNVNDTFGHLLGDAALQEISQIIRKYTGRGISAFRYGGEELCLMMLRVPEKRSREIAEEIRSAVEETVCANEITLTISGGLGVSQNGEDVFREADKKLYEAKQNGKNQIR